MTRHPYQALQLVCRIVSVTHYRCHVTLSWRVRALPALARRSTQTRNLDLDQSEDVPRSFHIPQSVKETM